MIDRTRDDQRTRAEQQESPPKQTKNALNHTEKCLVDSYSVKEAARLLGVSDRSVYGYIEKGILPSWLQDGLMVIDANAVRQFRRRAVGRARTRQPLWHHTSSRENIQFLMKIEVPAKPGVQKALEQRLTEIRTHNYHPIPGTIARYIAWSHLPPRHVCFIFVWRKDTMPPYEQRIEALAALHDELDEFLLWESAERQEYEMLLHT